MKGYIPIFTHMVLISLVFSFFLPRQSWGKDPEALPQKGTPIVVRGAGAETDEETLRQATASLLKLFLATLLLLLFVLVSVVLAILLRRRRVASRERPEPTVLEDLWTKTEE